MPFVKRDNNNLISAIFSKKQDTAQEEVAVDDIEIIEFLKNGKYSQDTSHLLNQSDSDFIRVLEDLLDTLLEKHILLLTDLPEAAQQKMLNRKKIREKHIQSILSEDDDIF